MLNQNVKQNKLHHKFDVTYKHISFIFLGRAKKDFFYF